MTTAVLPHTGGPDRPARRLVWVLPAAVLVVLLGVLWLGKALRAPLVSAAKTKPMEAQLYELPPARGAAPGHAATPVPATPPARRPPAAHAAPPQASVSPPAAVRPPATPPRAQAGSPLPAKGSVAMPSAPPPPARTRPRPTINWATLDRQINAAVARSALGTESRASLPHTHNPHTLVARYYVASVLRKLERVGDMDYPTDMTGTPVIRIVVGSHGELLDLKLLGSSGNDALDRTAKRIARESAPFAPFPISLRRQTPQIELIVYMIFNGYRQLYTDE